MPGRSGYSFFSSKPADAYVFARSACLRDIGSGSANSLICEPIVLKVRFSPRTWLQADFIQEQPLGSAGECLGLSVAVLGPIPFANVIDVLHCTHGRQGGGQVERVRTFADGALLAGIRRLRAKTSRWRPDAWILSRLGMFAQKLAVWLKPGCSVELTVEDQLRRLSRCKVA